MWTSKNILMTFGAFDFWPLKKDHSIMLGNKKQ